MPAKLSTSPGLRAASRAVSAAGRLGSASAAAIAGGTAWACAAGGAASASSAAAAAKISFMATLPVFEWSMTLLPEAFNRAMTRI